MKKSVIAIIDEDEGFVQRLSDYFSDSKSLGYKVSGFTQLEKLENYSFLADVIFVIAGENFIANNKEITFAPVIRICEELGDECKDGIYRYRPGDYYLKRFFEVTGLERTCINIGEGKGAKIIGIYSPIARMFKTSFALTLGQILAKNYRCLYLNFENYSGFIDLFREESVQNMADMIYCFKNISEDFHANVKNMVKNINGLDYIKPVLSYTDLFGIEPDTWNAILTSLSEWGEYDYILLDLSDSIQGLFEILSRCSLIYTAISADEVAVAKTNQYELMVRDMDKEEIIDKTKKYTLPVFKKIPADPGELIRSEMGGFVRELVRGDFAI